VNFDKNQAITGTPKIYLSGAQDANVVITWPDLTTETASVSANTVTTVDATVKIANTGRFSQGNDGVFSTRTSIKIVSDAPISVHTLNQLSASTGASQAYPTEAQGYDYRVLNSHLANDTDSRFSVIANESGTTTLTITPKSTIATRFSIPERTAGTPYTITLTEGQIYSVGYSNGTTVDSRGTRIQSDKKITVSASNMCVSFPGGACDHITEYMPPVATWGTRFIVPATTNTAQFDSLAVMASEDNTLITVNGVDTTLALAGDVSEFPISAVGATTVITSNKRVLVAQFVHHGAYTDGTITRTGDPAMVLITPTAQYLNDVTFTTPATGFAINQASIVVRDVDVASVTLDGSPIPSNLFGPLVTVGVSNYKVAKVNLSLGAHRVTSTNGVGVLVYGYNSSDSYAYSASAGLVNLATYPNGVAQVGYSPAGPALSPSPSPSPSSSTSPSSSPSPSSSSSAPAAVLAVTGVNVEWLVVVGVVASILGASFLAISRRKRIW
jgi:hypothetical protein